MLFSDMKCLMCGSPPGKTTLGQDEKPDFIMFHADGSRSGNLTVTICDTCLAAAGRQGRVTRSVTEHRPPNIYEYIWNPDGEDEPYRYPAPKLYPAKRDDDGPAPA